MFWITITGEDGLITEEELNAPKWIDYVLQPQNAEERDSPFKTLPLDTPYIEVLGDGKCLYSCFANRLGGTLDSVLRSITDFIRTFDEKGTLVFGTPVRGEERERGDVTVCLLPSSCLPGLADILPVCLPPLPPSVLFCFR
uniref:Uncharacterized protein n=1 Tax=Chromera velia CCMP2878 TaxID=1169474 RepID=A0A0G4F1G6_9ALVE|eukprot:Cvel_14610.t1-p1 / transcript=Cvel_14610.t1 / gene=Cvel_14610 / organism=Chromera_velia_CCMP2878 / gene_product=hypothetical protein / transcript_product=hypothetical protein / location=Cvel_scaffold1045:2396-2815(+) / protein_length=140 / sequence_SO=supercontig / SO=protein_coding / is_pseudo=false